MSDSLIDAGNRLARPCFCLGDFGGEVVAYWGGERSDDPNTLPPEAVALVSKLHLLTVDAALFERPGLDKPAGSVALTTYEAKSGELSARLTRSQAVVKELKCSGDTLSARPAICVPPLEALCLYGDEPVVEWLASLGLARHQYDLAALDPSAAAYQDYYLSHSPFHRGDADVIIGGWHVRWPEDDFYLPIEMSLLLITIRDSEPFWEVFESPVGNIRTKQRIT